jgi:hypothetical protein
MDGRSSSVLARLQLGIERLYRVDTQLAVEDFVIDEEQRREAGVARAPREQLLIAQQDGHDGDGEEELSLGLFVDPAALDNLARNDPAHRLDDANFGDFCLAVEGVSHFVYLALCAAGRRRVSVLELELQAEVDKFVCCLLVQGARRPDLRGRLYEQVRFADDLSVDERDRYRTANEEAGRYAATLDRRFVREDRLAAMLRELRAFYRMALDAKLAHISRTAA